MYCLKERKVLQSRLQCMFVRKLEMRFWCTGFFFSLTPATSSKDVTTRLLAVPSLKSPSLLPLFLIPPPLRRYLISLSFLTHSPVLRRPQQEKAEHCSTEKELWSPPLLVQCHTSIPLPLPYLCTSWCKSVVPGDEKPLKMCVHRSACFIDHA